MSDYLEKGKYTVDPLCGFKKCDSDHIIEIKDRLVRVCNNVQLDEHGNDKK